MSCDCKSHLTRLISMSMSKDGNEADRDAIMWGVTTITNLLGDTLKQKELLHRAGQKISLIPFMEGVTEEKLEKTGINKLLKEIWAAVDSKVKVGEDGN